MDSWAQGVVEPMPTFPLLPETKRKGVEVPLSPITNIGVLAETVVVAGSIETNPQGLVLPMPTNGLLTFAEPSASRVVPVAVRPAVFSWPEIVASPWTARVVPGVAVATPSLFASLSQFKPVASSTVVPVLG